jgi:hypothetical protein
MEGVFITVLASAVPLLRGVALLNRYLFVSWL